MAKGQGRRAAQPEKSDYDKCENIWDGLLMAALGTYNKEPYRSLAFLYWRGKGRRPGRLGLLKASVGSRELCEESLSDAVVHAAKEGDAALLEGLGKFMRLLKDDKLDPDPRVLAVLIKVNIMRQRLNDPKWSPGTADILKMLSSHDEEVAFEEKQARRVKQKLAFILSRPNGRPTKSRKGRDLAIKRREAKNAQKKQADYWRQQRAIHKSRLQVSDVLKKITGANW